MSLSEGAPSLEGLRHGDGDLMVLRVMPTGSVPVSFNQAEGEQHVAESCGMVNETAVAPLMRTPACYAEPELKPTPRRPLGIDRDPLPHCAPERAYQVCAA